MALTKAHFTNHVSLEPLTKAEVARSKKKISKLMRAENYFYRTYGELRSPLLKKLGPAPERLDLTHIRDHTHRKRIKTEALDEGNNSCFVKVSDKVAIKNQAVSSLIPASQHSDDSILVDQSHGLSCVKKVTFALPNPAPSTGLFSFITKESNDLFTDKSPIVPSIPMIKNRMAKQEHITYPPSNSSLNSIPNDTYSNHKQHYKRLRCHNRLNDQLTEQSEASSFKGRSLAQKVQNRRAKGYLIKHTLPKLTEVSRDVISPKQPSPNLTLQKARTILLQKMHNQSIANQNINSKRLVILPSLAAPCSEEFAVAMRRIYGSKFISSPNILDHVVKRNVPYKETAMLLDALVRPPSTPSLINR